MPIGTSSTSSFSGIHPSSEPPLQLGAGIDFTSPDSPLAGYYLRASDVLAVLLLSGTFVIACVAPLPLEDVRRQLELGTSTLRHGVWAQGPPAKLSWFFPTSLTLIFRLGQWLFASSGTEAGVDCLRGVYALLVVARLLFLWLAFRRVSGDAFTALAGLTLTLALSLGRLPRLQPILLGEVFFAGCLLTLTYPRLSQWAIQLVCITFVIWANVHESIVLGFAILLIGLITRIATASQSPNSTRSALQLTGILIVSFLLAILLNPRGPFILATYWQLAHDPAFLSLDAWQPLRFHFGPGPHWTFLFLWLIVLASPILARRFYSPLQLLSLLVFGLWPLCHQQILLAWLMVVPWCVMALAPLMIRRLAPSWWTPSIPSFRKTILATLFALIALTWFPPIHWLMGGKPAPLERGLSQSK